MASLSFLNHNPTAMASLDMAELLRRVKRATKRDTPDTIVRFFEEKDTQDENIRRNHELVTTITKRLARNPIRVSCYCAERFLFRSWINYSGTLFDVSELGVEITPALKPIRRRRDYVEAMRDISGFIPACRIDVPRDYWFLLTSVFQMYPGSFVETKKIHARLSALDRTALLHWASLSPFDREAFGDWIQLHMPLFYSYFTGLESADYLLMCLFPLKLR